MQRSTMPIKDEKKAVDQAQAKRVMDAVLSLMLLVLLSPLFLIIGFMNMQEKQKGSILYKQKRIGAGGKPFYIYKFRTMVVNAEEVLRRDQKLYAEFVQNGYKLPSEQDPRITKTGRFLRETSLDELPQLLNVLKGDMSLVGPRPIIAEELEEYAENKQLFLSVKPGMTGLWQVSGRSDLTYPERMDLELEYIRRQRLSTDIFILFKTAGAVLRKQGAY
ncbi:Sugar transferase involved in LPS biosynthesis (colanic, teichoic acid) [Marinococcus luteus]|uniref:Sugar transferase involved in LPS biosynthesis (Colanic, teichoic acid) n=1 Tax=Marinococcus luteus TaxID=1122204 RepID=A0A1H2TGW7_9BACI|nr:sugar transferase [Marinococcus luteus]SDW43203.1 Sugar transferase involved in LPS biosynthesis (colanic, teichoic acid) [Marinococcus luteus]